MAYVYRGKNRDVKESYDAPTPTAPAKVFDHDKCGTYAGYKQHWRHKDTPCRDCRDAKNEYNQAWKAKNTDAAPKPRATFKADKCGTYAGYLRHLRFKVTPCIPCKIAHSKYMAEYRVKKKACA